MSLRSFFLCLLIALAGCGGYAPGSKSYWDGQVRELCEREAGVTVYEELKLSKRDFEALGGGPSGLPLPPEWMRPEFPYFVDMTTTKLREMNPEVGRTEVLVKRREDKKVLGKAVTFYRKGGDIPSGLFHESSFSCSEKGRDLNRRIFRIEG